MSASVNPEDYLCSNGSDEHDYELTDERDGWSTYVCRECGAELQEESA
jgi:hypothetical protein